MARTKYWKAWENQHVTGSRFSRSNKSDITILKKGVWQYLVDHATPHSKGYVIRFIVRDRGDFWNRVEARANGTYKRYDTAHVGNRVEAIIHGVTYRSRIDKQIHDMRSGSFFWRIVIFIRHIINAFVEGEAEVRARKMRGKKWYEEVE